MKIERDYENHKYLLKPRQKTWERINSFGCHKEINYTHVCDRFKATMLLTFIDTLLLYMSLKQKELLFSTK